MRISQGLCALVRITGAKPVTAFTTIIYSYCIYCSYKNTAFISGFKKTKVREHTLQFPVNFSKVRMTLELV